MSGTPKESNLPDKNSSGLTGRQIVYDEDGKPCRACNTLLDFKLATGKISAVEAHQSFSHKNAQGLPTSGLNDSSTQMPPLIPGSKKYRQIEPPDVEQLGRSSWTLLHTMAARYPKLPTNQQKNDMRSFLRIFSQVYPCTWCAKDFEKYIAKNAPKVDSQDDLGKWICEAHNDVNRKLGKPPFDCNFWKQRWKEGWED